MTNIIDKLDALHAGGTVAETLDNEGEPFMSAFQFVEEVQRHWPAIARALRAAGKLPIKKRKSGGYFIDFARNGKEADAVWQLGEALDALKEEE